MTEEAKEKETPPVETPAEKPAEKPAGGSVPSDLEAEIDGAVDEVSKEQEAERAAAESEEGGDDKPPVKKDDPPPEKKEDDKEDLSEGDESEEEKKKAKSGADEESSVKDEHLERAVKAGMTIATARTFKDAKALEEVVSMLETKSGKVKENSDDDAGEEDVDLLAGIPELDPEKYDEKIVAGFKSMKDIIGSLQDTIKGLKSDGATNGENWFDSQVKSLDKDFAEALKAQPEKLVSLKQKFDVLTAGYKASDQTVDQTATFKEAMAVVLGDVAAKVASTVKSEKLAERGAKHTNRPSGAVTPAKGDAFENVADEIDQEYFDKK